MVTVPNVIAEDKRPDGVTILLYHPMTQHAQIQRTTQHFSLGKLGESERRRSSKARRRKTDRTEPRNREGMTGMLK
jgi:hypothetical protein